MDGAVAIAPMGDGVLQSFPMSRKERKLPRGLLTSEQAAAYLGVTRTTVWRWVKSGELCPQEAGPSSPGRRGAMYFSEEYLKQRAVEWAEKYAGGQPETE